ncbi:MULTISPECIES: SusC/RagA family TonB-linked outer membrane protein [Chitinophagaceae]
MRTKGMKYLLLSFMTTMLSLTLSAQTHLITGTVKDTTGAPIEGVAVEVKGGKLLGSTGVDGAFSVAVGPTVKTLTFNRVGFAYLEKTIEEGISSLDVVMSPMMKSGDEVVVTALGIKREKKALGYAVQEVKGQALVEAREPNLVNDLSGKVAGLQVVRSGNGISGSSQIVLRGNNSLTGLSQPLIVVDGIPMENATGRANGNNDFWNPTLDMGNGLSDINADDIESVSVLKGPAAAGLYGALGGNGVILITTKSGKKQQGLGLTYSSSVGFSGIFTNPEMQKTFGQGSNELYSPTSGSSWGPKIEGQSIADWTGATVQMQSFNNVDNYFQTGIASNQNISFQQLFNGTAIYTSYNRMDNKDIVPGSKLTRNNITTRAVTKFGKNENWTLDTKIQFINATANNRPLVGQNINNAFATLYNLPISFDIRTMSNPLDSAGNMRWYQTGNHMNPYWSRQYNLNTDTRNRFLLNGSLKHKFADWLSGEINGGADMYTTNTETKLYAGSPGNMAGSYGLGKQTYKQTNFSAMFTAKKDDLFGKLGGSVMAGGNLMAWENSAMSVSASSLVVPNLFTITNYSGTPSLSQSYTRKKMNSLYGALDLNYDGYLFLNSTFRNDWSSTLSSFHRSFFYPSVSVSWVITDMMTRNGATIPSWLTYAKLRGSFAEAGGDLDPYQLYNTYYIGTDPNSNPIAYRGTTLYNDSVKAQLMKSLEAGLEMRFFKGRLGFDLTVYKTNTTNQLISLPMDPLSGYSGRMINAGNVQNSGIELTVDGKILNRTNGFNWNATVNYSHNSNTVPSIYPDVSQYQLGGYDNIKILAVAGQKFGEIYGTQFLRVTDKSSSNYGQLILSSGVPQADPNVVRLGNQQASGLLGVTNAFSYKNFGLSFQVDARFGGKIFSGTLAAMELSGTSALTVVNGGRDSMVIQGVNQGSDGQYTANTTKISPQKYWSAIAGNGNVGITEANLYDASNVRLRNVQVSYTFPKRMLAGSFIQKAALSVSCNNVWLISSHIHGIDPESVYATGTSAVGFENGSSPTSRTFFVNLTLGF